MNTLLFEFELTESGRPVYRLIDDNGVDAGQFCLVPVGEVETVEGTITQPNDLPLFDMVQEAGRCVIVNNATGKRLQMHRPQDVMIVVIMLNQALDLKIPNRTHGGGGGGGLDGTMPEDVEIL